MAAWSEDGGRALGRRREDVDVVNRSTSQLGPSCVPPSSPPFVPRPCPAPLYLWDSLPPPLPHQGTLRRYSQPCFPVTLLPSPRVRADGVEAALPRPQPRIPSERLASDLVAQLQAAEGQ